MTETTWVFAAGMRRSASTLQYHLAKDLLESVGGYAAGWVTWQNFDKAYVELDDRYPFVILKCHAFLPGLSTQADILFQKNRARSLTIFRDPRDVAASMLEMEKRNFPDNTWAEVLRNLPVLLHEFRAWASLSDEQCLVQDYDTDTISLFEEIAEYLEIDYTPTFKWSCIQAHTIDAHRKLITEYEPREEERTDWNAKTLLWYNHIRDGKPKRYQDELTPEQITDVDNIIEAWQRKL